MKKSFQTSPNNYFQNLFKKIVFRTHVFGINASSISLYFYSIMKNEGLKMKII